MEIQLYKNLPRILSEKGISFKELSRETNVPVKTLYGWTHSPRQPNDIVKLKNVCQYLEVTLDEILFSDKPSFGQKIYVSGNKLEILFTC
jgi:transcriptional regulator with XRE-family HTH domain